MNEQDKGIPDFLDFTPTPSEDFRKALGVLGKVSDDDLVLLQHKL